MPLIGQEDAAYLRKQKLFFRNLLGVARIECQNSPLEIAFSRGRSMLNHQQITEHLLRQRLALTSTIYTVTRNFHLAEDVFQEVSVKAMSQDQKFETTEHLTNWFRRSARNRAIDIIHTR